MNKTIALAICAVLLLGSILTNIWQYSSHLTDTVQAETSTHAETKPSLSGQCRDIISAAAIFPASRWGLINIDNDETPDLLIVSKSKAEVDMYAINDRSITYIGHYIGTDFFLTDSDGTVSLASFSGQGSGVGSVHIYTLDAENITVLSDDMYSYFINSALQEESYNHNNNPISEEEYEAVVAVYCNKANAVDMFPCASIEEKVNANETGINSEAPDFGSDTIKV